MKLVALVCLLVAPIVSGDFLNFYNFTTITNDDLRELRKTELRKLNDYRMMHGVSPVFVNESLNAIAQNYSEYLNRNDQFNHSSLAFAGKYGENLFRRGSIPYLTYNFGDATKMWYDEVQYYNFETASSVDPSDPAKQVYHFTAQIWRGVTSVGFGFAGGPRERVHEGVPVRVVELYVVAIYYPTPNIIGLFPQNVPRAL